MEKLVECVPNFSEGRNVAIIKEITDEVETVEGARLLDVDPGASTNRTVVTFVGSPDAAVEAAFRVIKKAATLIDMSAHTGEHPRMGATDVCPFVPIANVTLAECAQLARRLGKRVGEELGISVYLYEEAASEEKRRNLATCREGQYEGMAKKLLLPEWKPDFGPTELNVRAGVTAIGARDFLVAYNVNLNTTSTRRANSVAFDVREAGRVKREGDPITGKVVTDAAGVPLRVPGSLTHCKAIGWFIEDYGIAQISINLTNIAKTSVHRCFDEVCARATARGLRVTGSEVVGLMPLNVLTDAGRHYLRMQGRSEGVSEEELVHIAVKSLGLDDLKPFDPRKKVVEYMLRDANPQDTRLARMSLRAFCNETLSESPAPGGGSVAALLGALGASLAGMVANLSAGKRGWDARVAEFSGSAADAQQLKDCLLQLVDEDTRAFDTVMDAYKLPKGSDAEKAARAAAIEAANKTAAGAPLQVMRVASRVFALSALMVRTGNPSSVTDAGVSALCARAAVEGAYLNVKVNVSGIKDAAWRDDVLAEADQLLADAKLAEAQTIAATHAVLDKA